MTSYFPEDKFDSVHPLEDDFDMKSMVAITVAKSRKEMQNISQLSS